MGCNAGAAEPLLQRGQDVLKVGVLAVHLVDEDNAGCGPLIQEGPRVLGSDLYAGWRRHEHNSPVGNPQAGNHLTTEVRVARSVDHVDLVVAPDAGHERQLCAAASLDLLRLIVGSGVAILDPAHAGCGAGGKEQGLRERGLAGTTVREEYDVSQLIR